MLVLKKYHDINIKLGLNNVLQTLCRNKRGFESDYRPIGIQIVAAGRFRRFHSYFQTSAFMAESLEVCPKLLSNKYIHRWKFEGLSKINCLQKKKNPRRKRWKFVSFLFGVLCFMFIKDTSLYRICKKRVAKRRSNFLKKMNVNVNGTKSHYIIFNKTFIEMNMYVYLLCNIFVLFFFVLHPIIIICRINLHGINSTPSSFSKKSLIKFKLQYLFPLQWENFQKSSGRKHVFEFHWILDIIIYSF